MTIDLENESPKPDEPVLCMIMTMRQGKTNQHGKLEYMGCLRNIDPVICPLSALAFYFFSAGAEMQLGNSPPLGSPRTTTTFMPCPAVSRYRNGRSAYGHSMNG